MCVSSKTNFGLVPIMEKWAGRIELMTFYGTSKVDTVHHLIQLLFVVVCIVSLGELM
jgi:hypothetical protein